MTTITNDRARVPHAFHLSIAKVKLSWNDTSEIGDRRSKSYDLFFDFLTRTGPAIFGRLNAKAANEARKMRNKYVK